MIRWLVADCRSARVRERDSDPRIIPEMMKAGAATLLGYFGGDDPSLANGRLAAQVFRAMFLSRGIIQGPCAIRNPEDN
jgi:hypothetical protein